MKSVNYGLGMLVLSVVLAGCRAGIPKAVHQSAEQVPDRIKAARSRIARGQQDFAQYKQGEAYKKFAVYADRESWDNSFAKAEGQLAKASQYLKKNIEPLLDDNEPKNETEVRNRIVAVNGMIRDAEQIADHPTRRRQFLADTMQNAPLMVGKAGQQLTEIEKGIVALTPVVRKAQKEHPHKKADLDQRLGVTHKQRDDAKKGLAAARAELKKSDKDWAVLGDGAADVGELVAEFRTHDKDIRARTDQLGRSYSKVLVDMRADYMVSIGRSDWNEYSEYDHEQNYTFAPVAVSPQQFEWYDKQGDDEINEDAVVKLGLNPNEAVNNTHRTFWVEDSYVAFFHKYEIIENERKQTTDWVPVDEAMFEANEDNLGMELLSKPKGMYEDEALKVAAPPGMAYVGNPHYGHWGHHRGSRIWIWLGRYGMFGWGRHRYGYDEWDDWRRNFRGKKPYYGPANQDDRHGSYASGTRSQFANSHWSRSGGFGWQDASVRGAGGSYRGGGPGGGGK